MLFRGRSAVRRAAVRGTAMAAGAVMAVVTGCAAAPAAHASSPTTEALRWGLCDATAHPGPPGPECATLAVPVDWAHPDGPTFGLDVARRKATAPGARVGSMVFGPGGPGDSGVDRVVSGISRFSPEIRRRFDIVSFDPRGVGGSSPVTCSDQLLAERPSPEMKGQADFDATLFGLAPAGA